MNFFFFKLLKIINYKIKTNYKLKLNFEKNNIKI